MKTLHVISRDSVRRDAASKRFRALGYPVQCHESADAIRKNLGATGDTAGLLAVYVPPPVALELHRAELIAVSGLHRTFVKASILCMSTEEPLIQAARALGIPTLFYDAVADLAAQIFALSSKSPRAVSKATARNALTPREESVLTGLKAGLSIKEIAVNLDISPNTVSTYKVRLMQKLGHVTNAELLRGSD